jgi:hypothetical protein
MPGSTDFEPYLPRSIPAGTFSQRYFMLAAVPCVIASAPDGEVLAYVFAPPPEVPDGMIGP